MRLFEFDGTPKELDKPTPTINDIMDKFGVGYKYIMSQLQQGIKIELEHTSDIATAKEIALDHLGERPDYYERLKKVEEHKKGFRARKYNKKPKKFIEPIKPKKPEKATTPEGFTPLQIAVMEGGHSLDDTGIVNELNVSQTLNFIKQAHGDQLYGNLPYWKHPRSVALTGRKIFGPRFNSDAVKTAFLHDVVEDTHIGIEELKKLDFSPEVIQAVSLLTKNKAFTYAQNIENIINSGNKLAMMVKYADNYENFTGDKSTWDPAKAASSQKKYLKSLNTLGQALNVNKHQDLAQTLAVQEGWKDWVTGAGLAAMAAGGGGAAWDAYKASQDQEKPAIVQPAKTQQSVKKDLKKPQEISPNAVPKKAVTGSPHEKFLTQAAVAAGIKGTELAQFLAQTAHESDDFKAMVEYGDPDYFKKYEPKFLKDKKTKKVILDPKTKKPKNFNPKAASLGNDMPGDGIKYKGRGYIQLTGKYNYKRAGDAIGVDLVKNPQLVEKPEIAAKVAVWFWQNRVQPKVDNFNNTKAATKPINPGLKGLEQRHDKFQDFKLAMR